MKKPLIHTRISQGHVFELGNRKVEIMRAYPSQWIICCFIDGNMLTGRNHPLKETGNGYKSYQSAVRLARRWVRCELISHAFLTVAGIALQDRIVVEK